jgi:hypothetical protein
VISFSGCHRCSQCGAIEGGVMPPKFLAPSKSNRQWEEQVLGPDLLVVRDDDGLTRPFQVMSRALIHHQY